MPFSNARTVLIMVPILLLASLWPTFGFNCEIMMRRNSELERRLEQDVYGQGAGETGYIRCQQE